VSIAMAYLGGQVMVLVELLAGSSSKTEVSFIGSRQDQLVTGLIKPLCISHLSPASFD
jgi:mannose/fructose-specific phosphotransferase system component IIA